MTNKPDILFIMTDQHRADCMGIAGNRVIETPTMDNLAHEGVMFTRAYVTCPTCVPARRTLLCARHPDHNGLVGYQEGLEWNPKITMPQALRDGGYQTVLVGRHMHQYPIRKRYGYEEMRIQFDDYKRWAMEQVPRHDYERMHLVNYGPLNNDWTVHPWMRDEELHHTNWATTEARRVRQDRDPSCPLFLTLSYLEPHPPLTPPLFYYERYMRRELPRPVIGDWALRPDNDGIGGDLSGMSREKLKKTYPAQVVLEGERGREAVAAYYGMINHVDDQMHRMLCDVTGYNSRDTCVVYCSDHGELLGDHYLWRKSHAYEGSARIPFIIRLPDSMDVPRNLQCDALVCLEDLMPTLLDIAGLEIPDGLDGESLLPILKGEKTDTKRQFLHIEHAEHIQAIVTKKWKYIYFTNDGTEQLFDMQNDPHELHNAINDYPAEHRQMRDCLTEVLSDRPEGFVVNGELQKGIWFSPTMKRIYT